MDGLPLLAGTYYPQKRAAIRELATYFEIFCKVLDSSYIAVANSRTLVANSRTQPVDNRDRSLTHEAFLWITFWHRRCRRRPSPARATHRRRARAQVEQAPA